MAELIDLRSPEREWSEVMIGGGSPAVRLQRLHVDRETKATTSLVEFPDGWSRPDTGYYPCAEELLVISGSITVTGMTYKAGDYGYMPPFYERSASSSDGCLALAWFSGPPTWSLGTATDRITHDGAHSSNLVAYRPERDDLQGRASSAPQLSQRRQPGTLEVVDLATWRWCVVAEDEELPPFTGDVFQRWWA